MFLYICVPSCLIFAIRGLIINLVRISKSGNWEIFSQSRKDKAHYEAEVDTDDIRRDKRT